MCFSIEQLDRACGLLLLNEFNIFVYCCKNCQLEFESGPSLEGHILEQHLDDKQNIIVDEQQDSKRHIESVFVNDGIILDVEFEPQSTDAVGDSKRDKNQSIQSKLEMLCKKESSNPNDKVKGEPIEVALRRRRGRQPKKESRKRNPKEKPPSNNQVFYCDMCPDVTLSTLDIVRQHMRRHRENRLLKACTICNKKPRDLEKHMRLNHGDHCPYKCQFCGKSFRTNNNRINHERSHTGQAPFLCDQCGKSFRSQSSKTKHKNRVHYKKRPHPCPHCERAFTLPSGLKEHIFAFHTKERYTDSYF